MKSQRIKPPHLVAEGHKQWFVVRGNSGRLVVTDYGYRNPTPGAKYPFIAGPFTSDADAFSWLTARERQQSIRRDVWSTFSLIGAMALVIWLMPGSW